MAVPLLLAGCSSSPQSSINPVNWWHQLEGGEIAKQRPPPPGSNQPYPNLAAVPPRPAAPDKKQLESITQGLVADRAHAEYMAAATPIADPSSPQASPGLFGMGSMPPPPPAGTPTSAPTASASLSAASGPPTPPAPQGPPPKPQPAPRGAVQSAALSPPATAPAPGVSAATAPPTGSANVPSPGPAAGTAKPGTPVAAAAGANTPPAPQAAAGPPPAIPAAPPAPPKVPGAPPMTVAAATPPATPTTQRPGEVQIEFVAGSSELPPGANDMLKELVAQRGSAAIALTGHGDATSEDPAMQSAALSLALARAQATAKALVADGVPESSIRVGAEASGRGAVARLIQ
jgi:outer membrane protein OmpA-like peptidoglycan-associated protein